MTKRNSSIIDIIEKLFQSPVDKEREYEDRRRRIAYLKRKYSTRIMEDDFEPKKGKS